MVGPCPSTLRLAELEVRSSQLDKRRLNRTISQSVYLPTVDDSNYKNNYYIGTIIATATHHPQPRYHYNSDVSRYPDTRFTSAIGRLHRGDTADFKRKDQTVVIISTLDSGARGNSAINYNPLKYNIGAHFAILIISR